MKAKITFKGQELFVGIDVHLKTWNVSIFIPSGFLDRYSQPASAKKFFEHLLKNYPLVTYNAYMNLDLVDFLPNYALTSYGINCIGCPCGRCAYQSTGEFNEKRSC